MNIKTIEKVANILVYEFGEDKAVHLITRFQKETVPSGNAKFDEIIGLLLDTVVYMQGAKVP